MGGTGRGKKTGGTWLTLTVVALALATTPVHAADPVKIGLVAALSGQSAASGEAITRGLTVAIEEINAKGGVLGGRKVDLIRRDDESNPSKGVTAARELIFKEQVAALFGGIDSPVSLGGGDGHHAQRGQSELCLPRLRRRRHRGQGVDPVRGQDVWLEEARPHADQ
jgi:hypothetical protein